MTQKIVFAKDDGWNPWGGGETGGNGTEPPKQSKPSNTEDIFSRRRRGGGGSGFNGGNFNFNPKFTPKFILFGVLVVLGLWLISGFYVVQSDEEGIVLRFGKFDRVEAPGFHYHLPWPFETATRLQVTRVHRVNIGMSETTSKSFSSRSAIVLNAEDSLMLTGDENIVDARFSVFWVIKNAEDYLFKVRDPNETIKAAAESVIRDVIGQTPISVILTTGRGQIEQSVKEKLQALLDDYQTGIQVTQIQLQEANPPEQVIGAYRDVQAAKADQERAKNEAEKYRNQIVPEARGDAARITQAAQAEKERTVAEAEGAASKFSQIYEAYKKNPKFYKERLHIETMEEVLKGKSKMMVDSSIAGSNGMVPYLPLDRLKKK